MRKILIISLIALLAVVLSYGFADAVVTGPCANCHTMHNSQNGVPMRWDSKPAPSETLLKGDCIGCHGRGTALNIEFGGTTPQVLHTNATDLAGGNFAYITGAKTRDATDSGATKDTGGHNVIDLGATYYEDTIPNLAASFPPGDELGNYAAGLTRTTFTCAGAYGCHGDRNVKGSMAAIRGSHHANDTVLKFGTLDETKQGGTTALSYRFLKGVKGGEDSDWHASSGAADHNEYKGAINRGGESTIISPGGNTISGLCAECHGNFHGTGTGDIGTASPWLRHPTDIVLPNSGEYQYYNGRVLPAAATYSLDAPVARATIPTTAPSGNVNPGTDDSIVMCLSCHKVHGSANADILRWNYEDIKAGGGSDTTRCFICHTTKDTGS
jgi:hypothetical protein